MQSPKDAVGGNMRLSASLVGWMLVIPAAHRMACPVLPRPRITPVLTGNCYCPDAADPVPVRGEDTLLHEADRDLFHSNERAKLTSCSERLCFVF